MFLFDRWIGQGWQQCHTCVSAAALMSLSTVLGLLSLQPFVILKAWFNLLSGAFCPPFQLQVGNWRQPGLLDFHAGVSFELSCLTSPVASFVLPTDVHTLSQCHTHSQGPLGTYEAFSSALLPGFLCLQTTCWIWQTGWWPYLSPTDRRECHIPSLLLFWGPPWVPGYPVSGQSLLLCVWHSCHHLSHI